MNKGEARKEKKNAEEYTNQNEKKKEGSSSMKEHIYEIKNNSISDYGKENVNEMNGKEKMAEKKKEKRLYLRKEIFDAAIIYTTNKMEESTLLNYLRGFYEYIKNKRIKSEKDLNEELFINFDDWLSFNELMNNQDNALGSIFSVNICKALWTLLAITIQSVKKKNNLNKQKTIFNTNFEDLRNISQREFSNSSNNRNRGSNLGKRKNEELNIEESRKEELFSKYDKYFQKSKGEKKGKKKGGQKDKGEDEDEKEENEQEEDDHSHIVWNSNWQNEMISIELVIFFIILHFHKIDNVKRKFDRSLSEDCWPNYMDSIRSVGNNSFVNVSNLNNLSNTFTRQNLSDFFINSINGNCKHFLKSFLIAFLSSVDLMNSNTLSDMPLYFKNSSFFLFDFIIDTNDYTNVYQTFLQNNEYKILYKTKNILNWLMESLCVQEKGIYCNSNYQIMNSNVLLYSETDAENFFLNVGIEQVKKEVYQIKNIQGKSIYIYEDKEIIHINNCKDCNIFLLSKVEYLKVNICVDCYIICLSVEMITTLLNSTNIDFHLVTRNLKIENGVDCNIYIYTETNIIISGDTRNIQLAPYNILNSKQKSCLEKSQIFFNEKNCKLFAFPLNCKTNFSALNLSNTLKPSSNICSAVSDKNRMGPNKTPFTFKNQIEERNRSVSNKSLECSNATSNSLSGSITDYVYYLLNPANFFLVEFSGNPLTTEGEDEEENREVEEENREVEEENHEVKGENHEVKGKSFTKSEAFEKEEWDERQGEGKFRNFSENEYQKKKLLFNKKNKKEESIKGLFFNEKATSNLSSYINNYSNEDYTDTKWKTTYMCLFLPEVYKNAIENQDERIISFLNFMNNIKLTNSQKQKLTKILTFKLYEFIKKIPKTFRVLNDLTMKEQEKGFNFDYNGLHF